MSHRTLPYVRDQRGEAAVRLYPARRHSLLTRPKERSLAPMSNFRRQRQWKELAKAPHQLRRLRAEVANAERLARQPNGHDRDDTGKEVDKEN